MPNQVTEAARRKNQEMEKQAKERRERKDLQYPFFKLKEGANIIRLLPPPKGRTDFWMEYKNCFNVGPNGRAVIPPRQYGLPDPLSDEIDRLYKTGRKEDRQLADRMWPKTRFGMWVIDRNADKQEPAYFETNGEVFRYLTSIFTDSDYDDITDVNEGHDITIEMTPGEKTKNGFPEWIVRPKPKKTRLGTPEQIAEWTREDLFEKHKIGQPLPPEVIVKIMRGEDTREQQKKDDEAFFGKQGVKTPQPPDEDDNPLVEKFYVYHPVTKQVILMTDQQIFEVIKAGHYRFKVMPEDRSTSWKDVSEFGFVTDEQPEVEPPKVVPAKPQKSVPKPPPVDIDPESDDDQALKDQLAELRRRHAKGPDLPIEALEN